MSSGTFTATDPRTAAARGENFERNTAADARRASAAAAASATVLAATPPLERGEILRAIARGLREDGERILELADQETALGRPRLEGEMGRTCGQLELFADVLAAGEFLDAVIEHADPDATPPRPDLRRSMQAIGPVAVFGASNFPLAFSVPGGDTAAALAAGCPVVFKAHPAHPATSAACGEVIAAALEDAGAPAATFSLLHDDGTEVGAALALDEAIEAIAFTGSLRGGRALFDLAAARPRPIPVYAEMGSLNPVVVLPGGFDLASGHADRLAASILLGAGQFCTKPGALLLYGEPSAIDDFIARVTELVTADQGSPLLSGAIRNSYEQRLEVLGGRADVAVGRSGDDAAGLAVAPSVGVLDVATLIADASLREETFGPHALLVRVPTEIDLFEAIGVLPGSLTATVIGGPDDARLAGPVLERLAGKAGRLIYNGVPTGVAVSAAQHHGGPYPACISSQHTSVGTAAIRRFLRPVAYQDLPDPLLPPALQESNPWRVPRLVDGIR